ncbi:MAG: hypothetical protein IE883_06950, partial [Epsilonproteobacteria bacterium]|nr:hypothetical protein [Campylobacterota bacterium]
MSLNKLFLRWIAVFGLVGLFAVFGWGKGHNVFHENPFTPVFPNGGLRLYGDFVATGDSVLCQNNGAGGCNNAYNGYLYDTNLIYKNEEGMTLNSSSSTLTLPPDIGSNEIEWAGLYWQGHIADQNANRYSTSALVQNRGNVTFKLPDGTEQNITADKVWYHDFWGDGSGSRGGFRSFYQGFKDVTSLVKSHLVNGATQTFGVGNLKATHGRDWFSYFYLGQGAEYNGLKIGFWGNWSLIVVYKHNPATMPSGTTMKNINVFNGFDAMFPLPINGYETFDVEIPVSGFLTPKSGVVNAKMLFYASGGEKRINRDAFYIQNANNAYKYTAVSNTANPANNPFNGSVSNFGIPIDATINYYPGFDLDVYNVSNYMTNDQTSTALKLEAIFKSNNGDQSTPGAIAFSADLYTPSFCYDYTLKQDGRYLSIDRTDPIARINQQISSSPIELLVYLKNKEADILANGISIKADVNATRFDYAMTNPMYVSNPNGSSLIDRGKPYSSTNCFYSIGSGNGVSDAGCVALIENDTSTTNDDIRRIR